MGMLRKGTNGFQLTMLGTYGKVFYFSDQQVRNGEVILMSPFRTAPSGALLVHATLKTNTNGATQVIAVDLPPEPPHVYSPFTHFSVKMNIWYNKLCDTVDDVVVSRPYGQY